MFAGVSAEACGLRRLLREPIRRPPFALSWPFFSRPVSRQIFEVRKHRNSGHYRSMAYSRTFQAVGWRHCLPGGNHQPKAVLEYRPRDVTARVRSIRLLMARADSGVSLSQMSMDVLWPFCHQRRDDDGVQNVNRQQGARDRKADSAPGAG